MRLAALRLKAFGRRAAGGDKGRPYTVILVR